MKELVIVSLVGVVAVGLGCAAMQSAADGAKKVADDVEKYRAVACNAVDAFALQMPKNRNVAAAQDLCEQGAKLPAIIEALERCAEDLKATVKAEVK